MVTIVDYGICNLYSVVKAFNRIGCETIVSNLPKDIMAAEKLVLPGVGHFEKAMGNLRKHNLIDTLQEKVISNKTPILGICLGAQLFTSHSEEGNTYGLNWIKAQTREFKKQPKEARLKIPHVGWNTVESSKYIINNRILMNINPLSSFYFTHSYYMDCDHTENKNGLTKYIIDFDSIIENNNIVGVQFHPEKSNDIGLMLLKNFLKNY